MKKYLLVLAVAILLLVVGVAFAENLSTNEETEVAVPTPVTEAEVTEQEEISLFDDISFSSEWNVSKVQLPVPESVDYQFIVDVVSLAESIYRNCEEVVLSDGTLLNMKNADGYRRLRVYYLISDMLREMVPEHLAFDVNAHLDLSSMNGLRPTYVILTDPSALEESGYETLTEWILDSLDGDDFGIVQWNEASYVWVMDHHKVLLYYDFDSKSVEAIKYFEGIETDTVTE